MGGVGRMGRMSEVLSPLWGLVELTPKPMAGAMGYLLSPLRGSSRRNRVIAVTYLC